MEKLSNFYFGEISLVMEDGLIQNLIICMEQLETAIAVRLV